MRDSSRVWSVAGSLIGLLAVGAGVAVGDLQRRSLFFNGRERTWLVNVPESFRPGRPTPLVIAMHGGGGSAERFEPESGWTPVSEREGFIVVYPDGGLDPAGGDLAWDSFDFSNSPPNDLDFLLALVSFVKREFPIDDRRVYLTGFSNGSQMTNTLACSYADVFAAFAPVSGGWITAFGQGEQLCRPNNTVPTWIWRGENELQDFNGSGINRLTQDLQQLAFWRGFNDPAPTPAIVREVLPINDQGETRLYTTQVFARRPGFSAEVRFTVVSDFGHAYFPNAAELIWSDFFSRTVRPAGSPADIADFLGLFRPDGVVDANDFVAFIAAWANPNFVGAQFVDIADFLGFPEPDGVVDAADFVAFLSALVEEGL